MTSEIFKRAEEFIWKNARLLERRRFSYHFKNGSREDVLSALLAYQNADGGFGNALEPDIRCPESQPVACQHALEFLDEVGFEGEPVAAICGFLQSITTEAGGIPWLLPSAMHYPRAPWWRTDENPPASLNPTAAVAGLLLKNGVRHPWLKAAVDYCWEAISAWQPGAPDDLRCIFTFLFNAPDRTHAEEMLEGVVQLMFDAGLVAEVHAEGYVRKPLDWAPTPGHPLRRYFGEESIRANLEILAAGQQADGGWNIFWPATSPGCEMEWRGWLTVDALRTLRANGVI